MRILATKRTPAPELVEELGLDFLGDPEDLPRVLEESDFVELCIPWMPTTDKLIGEAALKSMKPTAYLVNIARARIVDEEALYRALTENWIAGFRNRRVVGLRYDARPLGCRAFHPLGCR